MRRILLADGRKFRKNFLQKILHSEPHYGSLDASPRRRGLLSPLRHCLPALPGQRAAAASRAMALTPRRSGLHEALNGALQSRSSPRTGPLTGQWCLP